MTLWGQVWRVALVATGVLVAGTQPGRGSGEQPSDRPITRITVLVDGNGGRVDWCAGNDLVAFSKFKKGEYSDLYLMRADGSQQVCLSCDRAGLPQVSNDQPTWHPSGEWVLFQSVDPALRMPPARRAQEEYLTAGGAGFHNNLWVISKDGKRLHKLTSVGTGEASLHPHFSRDGSKVLWSAFVVEDQEPEGQRRPRLRRLQPRAYWVMKVADFVVDSRGARLANERAYRPQAADDTFYETHDFSPDDRKILFSASIGRSNHLDLDIWTLELATERLTRLTNTPGIWDEHAHYSPTGKTIVWMTSRGFDYRIPETSGGTRDWVWDLRTEYWMMGADGSNPTRLTYFNEPGAPEQFGDRVVASDLSWNKDGTKIVALASGVDAARRTQRPRIVLIEFRSPM